MGAAHRPSHCWQAGEQAQDPNHLEKAPWGMNLGLLGTEQACLQMDSSYAGITDYGLLGAGKLDFYVLSWLNVPKPDTLLQHMLCLCHTVTA